MKPPLYEDARHEPLITDADIERRVSKLIGRATIRQLWLLFVDGADVQLPYLIPIAGLPTSPSQEQSGELAARIRLIVAEISAAAVIVVWERYGPAELTPVDTRWARSLHEAFDVQGIPLRALLLSHRRGVRWVAQDDYRFQSDAAAAS